MSSLFYARPAALRPQVHGAVRLRPRDTFPFAAATNAIPIAADEFGEVQAHYPIVFTPGEATVAVALVGLRDNENLFLEASGAWRAGAYVPAYVRRYPFGLARVEGSDQHVLAIDDVPEVLSDSEGEPLFDGEAPSETTRKAMAFCTVFEREQARAMAFAAALNAAGLLAERSAEWRAGDQTDSRRLKGFMVIDEDRFRALPPATVADWHARGWLTLAYAQLMSMLRWRALAALMAPATHAASAQR